MFCMLKKPLACIENSTTKVCERQTVVGRRVSSSKPPSISRDLCKVWRVQPLGARLRKLSKKKKQVRCFFSKIYKLVRIYIRNYRKQKRYIVSCYVYLDILYKNFIA